MKLVMPVSRKTRPADRRRFDAAVAALWEMGIVALGPLGAKPDRAHEILRRRVEDEFPGGMGSYLFWTSGDARAFGRDGSLVAPLTLYCSDAEVVEAAVAVLQDHGIDAAAAPEPDSIAVFPPTIVERRAGPSAPAS